MSLQRAVLKLPNTVLAQLKQGMSVLDARLQLGNRPLPMDAQRGDAERFNPTAIAAGFMPIESCVWNIVRSSIFNCL